MSENSSTYRQAFKATGIFGLVQVFQVLIILVKGKFVAVLLGAAGLGVNSLYFSALMMILQFTGLGLQVSALRNISQAAESNDESHINTTVAVFNRWLMFSSFLGAVILLVFAPQLSQVTFGDNAHIMGFRLLSLSVFFYTFNTGNITLLQGTRKLGYVAKASLSGSVTGLAVSIPLYYFYGVEGIVPALLLSSMAAFLVSSYFVRKLKIGRIRLTLLESFRQGYGMVVLGLTMMVASLLGTIVIYSINAFINHFGQVSDVGYYQAGMSITNMAVGAVFTAMASDYFPRLSAVCDDESKVNLLANEQCEIITLITFPLLIFLILSSPLLLPLLLSPEFSGLSGFIKLSAFGMFFKAASFSFGYISFAKGDKKTFFLLEGVLGNFLILGGNIIGYRLGGIEGMAVSFIVIYLIYFVVVNFVVRRLYNFKLHTVFIKIFLISLVLTGSAAFYSYFRTGIDGFVITGLIFSGSVWYALVQLNKRIGLRQLLAIALKRS
ncbi:MAG: O-antigen translocase [Bacteroidetes bacterium HGW-Bacteroidetes-3]|nr:MAG: O-antigen translocase [Bacteroidetes bacterium HGW-Bacteroidetes-3]